MTSASDRPVDELRILHWNIHSWRDEAGASNVEVIARLVQDTTPDVVSLVEVDESWDRRPATLDELAARLGYASIFVPTFEFGQDKPTGGFGNALLTNLPILAVRQRQLVWPPMHYDGTEPSEPRSAVFAEVQASTGRVWIGSTHLPRSDRETRADALRHLVQVVQDVPAPWLLVGDFNTPASSWITEQAGWEARPAPAVPTYPSGKPMEAIDYCVAPSGPRVTAEVLQQAGSDHLPVLVRCYLEGGPAAPSQLRMPVEETAESTTAT